MVKVKRKALRQQLIDEQRAHQRTLRELFDVKVRHDKLRALTRDGADKVVIRQRDELATRLHRLGQDYERLKSVMDWTRMLTPFELAALQRTAVRRGDVAVPTVGATFSPWFAYNFLPTKIGWWDVGDLRADGFVENVRRMWWDGADFYDRKDRRRKADKPKRLRAGQVWRGLGAFAQPLF